LSSLFPFRYWSNHTSPELVSAVSAPPRPTEAASWPPANQATRTAVDPAAEISRAVASDWSRPNNASCSPCRRRVGAVILAATVEGLDAFSRARSLASAVPVIAAR